MKILKAIGYVAAGYGIARALEARSYGLPLSAVFQPNLSIFTPVSRIASGVFPAERRAAARVPALQQLPAAVAPDDVLPPAFMKTGGQPS